MERRLGLRGQVDLPIVQHVDGFPHECRVVDISSRGLVLCQGRRLAARSRRLFYQLELPIADRRTKIELLGRTVWSDGPLVAVRYIQLNDAERLEIAELIDRLKRKGAVLH